MMTFDFIFREDVEAARQLDLTQYEIHLALECACTIGNCELVSVFLDRGVIRLYYQASFNACLHGHVDVVALLIDRGVMDWHGGFAGACRGGHSDLVDRMIEGGAGDSASGLAHAAGGGHYDLVVDMLQRGGGTINGLECALANACFFGHMAVVRVLFGLRDMTACDLNYVLQDACSGQHLEAVQLLIEKGATRFENCRHLSPSNKYKLYMSLPQEKRKAFWLCDPTLRDCVAMGRTKAAMMRKVVLPSEVVDKWIWSNYIGY
jgi:ankyrin repeat protein